VAGALWPATGIGKDSSGIPTNYGSKSKHSLWRGMRKKSACSTVSIVPSLRSPVATHRSNPLHRNERFVKSAHVGSARTPSSASHSRTRVFSRSIWKANQRCCSAGSRASTSLKRRNAPLP